MKKFLLSMAAVACAASMSATSYTVFDISRAGQWLGSADGYGQVVSFGDKKVTITTEKAASTSDLVAPNYNSYSWRIYKNSVAKFVAEGITMKTVVITYDDMNDGQYCVTMDLNEGWTGAVDGAEYTLESAGLSELILTASAGQGRVKTVVVSDTDEVSDPQTPTDMVAFDPATGEPGEDPELPEGVIYQNTFELNYEGWDKINDETLGDYSGWKINGSYPACLIANSYYSGANHAANAKIQREFDLAEYSNVKLSVDQAFGYYYPTSQVENFRLYIISGDYTDYPAFANFPAAAPAGKNWTEFANNEFDLSEYDGQKITIGFEYATDGTTSRAWELKNFVLSGDKAGAVNGIEVDENAPAVYYNLQGVRVANPENGLFIVVKGGKSTKVVL